jgi:CopG family nickel-responsive transcriptional regulator
MKSASKNPKRSKKTSPAHPAAADTSRGVTRFSISLPKELGSSLDRMAREKGYENRSQAIGDMVTAQLVEHHSQLGNREIVGSITLVYDHHQRHRSDSLTDLQHARGSLIVAALHVHLDPQNCLEILAVKGNAAAIRQLADELIAAKGVRHGKLTVTGTGRC